MEKIKNLLFVHIPKTGGSSIYASEIMEDQRDFLWNIPYTIDVTIRRHQPIFILEKYNNLSDYFIFTVVRNPFKRAYSYYKYYMRFSKINLSFKNFLLLIQTTNKSIDELKHLGVISTTEDTRIARMPFVSFTQSFYVFDSAGKMRIDKIYRHENLIELENDFNIVLPKINMGNYNQLDYQKEYTVDTIDLVKQLYAEDFINFNYSTDFI